MPTDLSHLTKAFSFFAMWALIGHIVVLRRRS